MALALALGARGRACLVALSLVAIGCAEGAEPTVGKFRCTDDCGPATGGGDADRLDTGEPGEPDGGADEDTSIPDASIPDASIPDAPDDTATPPPDTSPDAPDTTAPDASSCTPPSGVACTTIPQCGCPSGTNCDVTSTTGKTSCVAAGSKGLHQPCSALGQCAKGLSCVFDVCVPFCATAADCAASSPSSECRPVRYDDGGVVTDIPGFRVCQAQCDPMNPTKACGASATCIFVDSAVGKTACAAAASGTTAGSCAAEPFSCMPGYTCVGTGDCMRFCRVGFSGDCPGGKACLSFTDHPKIGAIEYGVCAY